jgi:hypothetical protein
MIHTPKAILGRGLWTSERIGAYADGDKWFPPNTLLAGLAGIYKPTKQSNREMQDIPVVVKIELPKTAFSRATFTRSITGMWFKLFFKSVAIGREYGDCSPTSANEGGGCAGVGGAKKGCWYGVCVEKDWGVCCCPKALPDAVELLPPKKPVDGVTPKDVDDPLPNALIEVASQIQVNGFFL